MGSDKPLKIDDWIFSYDSLYVKYKSKWGENKYYHFYTHETKYFYDLISLLEDGIKVQKDNLNELKQKLVNKEITQKEFDRVEYNVIQFGYSLDLDYVIDLFGLNLWNNELEELDNFERRSPYLEIRIGSGVDRNCNHSETYLLSEEFIKNYCKLAREFYTEKEKIHFEKWKG